jgi:hypothetical protein
MNRPGYLALRPLRSDLVSRSGVAVQLLNDDGNASRPGAVDAPRLKNAMQTFAELVGKIAQTSPCFANCLMYVSCPR